MAPTGLISVIGSPSMVTSMVPVACSILLPAISATAPPLMVRVGAVPAVSIWAALSVAQIVLMPVILVSIWFRVTLSDCPLTVSPE